MILSGVLFCACSKSNDTVRMVYDVENYIESRPDSALAVLQNLDQTQLVSDKDKAKYALYLSMALDKNYIDKTDFEVLQPALDYFSKHGSATDKLRTFYYQGRIYQNSGDNENALSSFVVSMNFGESSLDTLTKARNLFAQSSIYKGLYNWEKTIEASSEAASYYKAKSMYNPYMDCIGYIINTNSISGDYNSALRYLEENKKYIPLINIPTKSNYYSLCLVSLSGHVPDTYILDLLKEYQDNVPVEYINWISVAKLYLEMHDYTNALYYLELTDQRAKKENKLQYYSILSLIYDGLDNSNKALEAYKNYISISDSLDLVIFKHDTQFIEERYNLELSALKEKQKKNLIVSIAALLLIALSAAAAQIYNRLKISKMEYKLLYAQMEVERDNLNALLSKSQDLNEAAVAAVADRLKLLNKFFTAYISDNYEIDRKASKEMESLLDNKEEFMNSTRLAFTGTHPKFIQYLEEKGLTEWEINYCCLYALGLKGKEVGAYMKMRSHYNNSSIIREKLGIGEHDTNLGIYIRRLLENAS